MLGVLGLQGDVIEHVSMLKMLKEDVKIVKTGDDIKNIKGLIIPGGESTTIGKLIVKNKIDKAIKDAETYIFGTCAGAILLAKKIVNSEQFSLNLMDIEIERNAYGRQRESFEVYLDIPKLGIKNFKAIFIRAPVITKVNKGEVLAEYKTPVLVRQEKYLACTFHPELTHDTRIHEYFVRMVKNED